MDLSLELSQAHLDAEMPTDLDESGIERVPMADPGMPVGHYPEINPERGPASPTQAGLPHMRRKSVLPSKETCLLPDQRRN
jgi:serine/threonine-protein phosphatase 2A regulatory subunit B'